MTIKNTVLSVEDHLKASWAAVREQGGELPEQLNMANLATGILSIVGGGGKGDLGKLQKAVRADYAKAQVDYPVGTEFADTWNGQDQPLIIVNYQQTKGLDGALHNSVILQRKYASTNTVVPGTNAVPTSSGYTYIQNDYLNGCSEMVKSVISSIYAPCDNITTTSQVEAKWFLPTAINMMFPVGRVSPTDLNPRWKYWSVRIGSVTDSANSGRVPRDINGATGWAWLWQNSSASSVYAVNTDGSLYAPVYTAAFKLWPAFAIY